MSEEVRAVRIEVRNDLRDVRRAREAICARCAAWGASGAVCHAVGLASDELLANVVTHAWPGGDHVALVDLQTDGEMLTLVISDDGRPFDPTGVPRPDLAAPLEARPVGGLGVHLVRELMDRFTYERRDGRNVVTLAKALE
ncbi:MAG: hypothetical protein AMXMBFR64_17720 [Myxococcales bacterium]